MAHGTPQPSRHPVRCKRAHELDLCAEAFTRCLIHIHSGYWPVDRSFLPAALREAVSASAARSPLHRGGSCRLWPGYTLTPIASLEVIDSVGGRVSLQPVEGEAQFANAPSMGDWARRSGESVSISSSGVYELGADPQHLSQR
jgi:hypothetical protein